MKLSNTKVLRPLIELPNFIISYRSLKFSPLSYLSGTFKDQRKILSQTLKVVPPFLYRNETEFFLHQIVFVFDKINNHKISKSIFSHPKNTHIYVK